MEAGCWYLAALNGWRCSCDGDTNTFFAHPELHSSIAASQV
jgi:hypothetical protein